MAIYSIPVRWEMRGHVNVEADTAKEALAKIGDDTPLPTDASCIRASLRVDTEDVGFRKIMTEELFVPSADGEAKNTKIEFLYRDASNYKFYHEVVVAGCISDSQVDTIISTLDDGEYFIPSVVGLPCDYATGFDENEDDHPWCELSQHSFKRTAAKPTISISASELVKRFEEAKGEWKSLYEAAFGFVRA